MLESIILRGLCDDDDDDEDDDDHDNDNKWC